MSGNIVLFQSADEKVHLDVQLDGKTVWLTQEQMALLFGRSVSVISRHIGNALKEGEISAEGNLQKTQKSRSEGANQLYDLDVVISVGYRVKSQRGVEFRRWATGVLRRYVVDGHAENEKRLMQLGQVNQSFDGQDIYPSLQEKAANLLYFVVKNHSFLDGNKRIAVTMFLYFLDRNDALFASDGSKLIDDSMLVAVTIMIAESKPEEKDTMVKLVMNLLKQQR